VYSVVDLYSDWCAFKKKIVHLVYDCCLPVYTGYLDILCREMFPVVECSDRFILGRRRRIGVLGTLYQYFKVIL
jgi:hypothetical protein